MAQYKAFTEKSLTRLGQNIQTTVNNQSLDFDIDSTNQRVGIKRRTDSDYTYTAGLQGKDGSSITDVYMDESTNELVMIISDEAVTNATATDMTNITVNTVEESTTEITLNPNMYYKCTGQISELLVVLGPITNTNIYNEYQLEFTTGPTGATVVFEDDIRWLTEQVYQANTTYQISILNGVGIMVGVTA